MIGLNKYLLLGVAALSLNACSSGGDKINVQRPSGAQVNLKTGAIYDHYEDINGFGAARMVSSPGVEIYSLDDDMPGATSVGRGAAQNGNYSGVSTHAPRVILGNQGVEIFADGQPDIHFAPQHSAHNGSAIIAQPLAPTRIMPDRDGRNSGHADSLSVIRDPDGNIVAEIGGGRSTELRHDRGQYDNMHRNNAPGDAGQSIDPQYHGARSGNFVNIISSGQNLARIYFEDGSSRLNEDDIGVITGITSHYNPNEGQVLNVEGHAKMASDDSDPVRRKEMNLRLSMQRAYAVARALMYSGVPSNAIRTVAWGEDEAGTP